MAAKVTITANFGQASKVFEQAAKDRMQKAVAAGLNDVAFKARADVQKEMRAVFASPTQFTLSSIQVQKADPSRPVAEQIASVFIRDDYAATSTSPTKYLRAEELGGQRANKGSENTLLRAGILPPGVQTTPAGRPLTGSQIVQAMSGIKAFGEQGFNANMTAGSAKRLRRKKVVALKKTGSPFFLARSKLTEGSMGIFKLVGKGRIKALLWFDTKRPQYAARFHFHQVVGESVKANFARQMERAIRRLGKG